MIYAHVSWTAKQIVRNEQELLDLHHLSSKKEAKQKIVQDLFLELFATLAFIKYAEKVGWSHIPTMKAFPLRKDEGN